MTGRGGTTARAAVVAVLLATLVGCRAEAPGPAPSPSPTAVAPAPSPTTGLRLALVLPPASTHAPAELAAHREAIERFERRYRDELAPVRVVQPDAPAFVADVTALVAERGAHLVCVLGAGAGPVVVEVAPRFPTTDFCAAPAAAEDADIPPNVLLVDVRVEELAYVAGVAARLAGGPAPPGLVAGEASYAVDRQRAAFVAGINAAAGEPVTPYVGVPAADERRAYELAAAQFAAGVGVVYAAAGPGDAGVLRAAEEADGLVIGSAATLLADADDRAGDEPPPVLLTTDLDLMVAVEIAVGRALDTWTGGRATVGLAEDAVLVAPGPSPRAGAVLATVEDVLGRLRSGGLTPLPG